MAQAGTYAEPMIIAALAGLYELAVRGDGNCLFRAIAFFVYGDMEKHCIVRADVVDHVVANWNHFQPYLEGSYGDNDGYQYRQRLMRRTGPERRPTDGDYAEIVAAQRLYNRNIFVWDVNGEEPRQYVPSHGFLDCEQRSSGVSPQGPFPADAILLSHNEVGNHYSILIPSEIASDLPRPPRFSANTFFEIRQPVAEDEQSQSKGGEEAELQERNRHSVDREEKEEHEPEHEKDHEKKKRNANLL